MKKLISLIFLTVALIFIGCGGVESESSDNSIQTITGYVIDDPIVGATIEVYDENGNLIAKKENATDGSGKYSITLKTNATKYLIKVSNGKIDNKPFNSELYSICFENKCNVTPVTTIISLNFAKTLKLVSLKDIQNFAQNVLGIDDYQSTNSEEIKKIREYVKSQNVDIDYITGVIVNDLADGYADNNLTTQIFPSAKKREIITKTFQIDTNDIDNYQNRNLKIVNLITGEKVDINQPISYKDFGLNVALVEDYNYTLYDGSEENASDIIYLPFKPYSENKLDINSTIYYYIFLDPKLSNLPIDIKQSLINVLNNKYTNSIEQLKNTYKNYINYGDLYKSKLTSQISLIQDLLIKNELTKYLNSNTTSNTFQKIVYKTFLKKVINFNDVNKNYMNFGCVSIKNEDKKIKIYNILPVYLGFTNKNDFQTMENDGYHDFISSKSIIDSFNHNLIDENPGGLVGFTVSKLISMGTKNAGKPTNVSFDKNYNSYVIYKSYHLTSLSSILNYLSIVSKIIHIPLNNDKIQQSIKQLQTGDKLYTFAKKTFDSISTGLTIVDSIISVEDILHDEDLLKAFNIPYNKYELEKFKKTNNQIKDVLSNLNKFTSTVQNTINQFNMVLPKPKPLSDVALDEIDMTKTLESFINKVTNGKYNNLKLFSELSKIPTYDGKFHLLLISAATLAFYVDDKNYANYYDKFIKNYPDKSKQSAYFNTNKLSVAMYIIFNAMKAKKENNKKLDSYAKDLYKKGILIIPGNGAKKTVNRFDVYKATLNTLKYFYKLKSNDKRNIFDYVYNLNSSLEYILSNIKEKINLTKSISDFSVSLSKELSKKDIPTFIWEFLIKPSIEKGIEGGGDIIKEKVINLLTANPYGNLIQVGNEVAGKITSFIFFPNKITFKVKTDANNNVYFSSAINGITPVAFKKGIVEPWGNESYKREAFLKKPSNNSYYGVIVTSQNDNDASWYRPYFETIFKEPAAEVRSKLDDFDERVFAAINWEYEKCNENSIIDKYDINESSCTNFNNNTLSYLIKGDDIDGGEGGDKYLGYHDKFVLPYPDKKGDPHKNGSYFDFFDYLAVKFSNGKIDTPWGPGLKDSNFKIYNKTRGIYLDKISAKYFAFDNDNDSKFTSPQASDVVFKIANAKEFDYSVDANSTTITITNNSDINLSFLIINSKKFGLSTPPSAYSFDIPANSKKEIPITDVSILGNNLDIIGVDSLLRTYGKFIGNNNLMDIIYFFYNPNISYSIADYFYRYSIIDDKTSLGKYPFMRVKQINIIPNNPPYIDDYNIKTSNQTATLSVQATDPDNNPLTCSVNWGDGNSDEFDCDENITHTYSNDGEYNVTITATDDKGLSDDISFEVNINATNKITPLNNTSCTLFPGHYPGMWANKYSFAALRKDGTVVTWGYSYLGGDSSSVKDELHDVVAVYSTGAAFAALRKDGTVVTWGYSDYGGDSSSVKNELHDVVGFSPSYIWPRPINTSTPNGGGGIYLGGEAGGGGGVDF